MIAIFEKSLSGISKDDLLDEPLPIPSYELVLDPKHNLPQKLGSLVGVDHEIDAVLRGWEAAYPIVAVQGMSGVGKTRLALEIAYACLQRPYGTSRSPNDLQRLIRFTHAVWIDAHEGCEEELSLDKVLNAIGVVTDFPSVCQMRPERKTKEVFRLLSAYHVLVIIDGFEALDDGHLVEWLKQVPDPSKVLLTSRIQGSSVLGVFEINLTQWGLLAPRVL